MDFWIRLIGNYGLVVVFVNVLLSQLGVPLPVYPVLMLTGALAARGESSLPGLLMVAVAACLLADAAWYQAGKSHGRRVLRLLCRISLSPDSCVRQTESVFARWGAPSLMVAKFVPGFASVATALAGAMGITAGSFLLFDLLGASLWAGVGLALGAVFSDALTEALATLVRLGEAGLGLAAAAVLLFLAVKWWQRRSFEGQLRMTRIDVAALADLAERGTPPLLIDVRMQASWAQGLLPGARSLGSGALAAELDSAPNDTPIVVYCACPNDASAVVAARRLMERGFTQVRPLAGGLDAWVDAGHPLETEGESGLGTARQPQQPQQPQ